VERALCPIMVGRDEPLGLIEDDLLAAHRGEGRLVILTGEAGVGKSRLAAELERRARLAGTAVMRGGCAEAELSLPYLSIVEAVGTYLDAAGAATIRRQLGPAAVELARIFPQLARQGASAGPDDPQTKLRLFESILLLLRLPAAQSGLLLVIEDLHWADAATLEFLDYARRRVQRERILLLLTSRSEGLHRVQSLNRVISGWRRTGAAEVIELEALTPDGVAQMVNAIFEGRRVGHAFRDFVHARSDGNPLVVEELLKAALDQGGIFLTDSGWRRKALSKLALPRTIKDLVLVRLQQMSGEEVAIARAAAVLGPSFGYQPLLSLSHCDEATLLAALRAFVHQQLMEETSPQGTYRFRHVLTRDAIYDDLIEPERVRLHEQAAQSLRELAGTAPVDLARHLVEAEQWDEAIPMCIKAADDAERRLAYLEAAALYERVLPHLGDDLLRATIACRLGNAFYLGGERRQAGTSLENGIAALEAQGRSAEAAHYRLVLGRCYWERSEPDRARSEYERARETLEPDGPSEDLALAYLRLSGLFDFQFRPQEALAMAEKAVTVADASGAHAVRIWAYNYLGLGLVGSGRVEDGLRFLDRSYQEAVAGGLEWIAGSALSNGISVRLEHFRGREALPMLERLRALRGRNRDILGYFYEGGIYLALGEPEKALRSSEEGVQEAEAWEATTFLGWIESNLAMIFGALGRFDDGWRVLARPHPKLERQDAILRAFATMRLALDAGDPARAAELIPSVTEGIEWSRPLVAQELQALDVAIDALVGYRQIKEAQDLLAKVTNSGADPGHPYVARMQGRMLQAAGDIPAAADRLTYAADFFAVAGYKDEERRTRRTLAAEMGTEVPPPLEPEAAPVLMDDVRLGERLVTILFADIRAYTAMTHERPPAEMAERLGAFYRWGRQEIERHHGLVDQFAGDAMMATFNVVQLRLDHSLDAVQAAIAIRDKAAFAGLPVGIGIATGAAVVGELAVGSKVTAVGETANLAARLQAEAARSEIVLSEETCRRARGWLEGRGLLPEPETVTLKGFAQPATVYRLRAPATTIASRS